jgi:hypothetical protein
VYQSKVSQCFVQRSYSITVTNYKSRLKIGQTWSTGSNSATPLADLLLRAPSLIIVEIRQCCWNEPFLKNKEVELHRAWTIALLTGSTKWVSGIVLFVTSLCKHCQRASAGTCCGLIEFGKIRLRLSICRADRTARCQWELEFVSHAAKSESLRSGSPNHAPLKLTERTATSAFFGKR